MNGTYDTNSVTPSCAYFKMNDGYFYCSDTGDLAGEWAGQPFDVPAAALPALKALFTSDRLPRRQQIAREWEGLTAQQIPRCENVALSLICAILGYVQNGMVRWGFRAHNKLFSTFRVFVAEQADAAFGNVDYEPMPVLDAVMDAHLTPEERAERDACQAA